VNLKPGLTLVTPGVAKRQSRCDESSEMNHDHYTDAYISGILSECKNIALVGASPNEARPSFGVMRFLLGKGYKVTPVNPGQAGKEILGQKAAASLSDLPEPADMIDIFRAAEAIPALTDEILALPWRPKAVWMQLAIRSDASAARLEAVGIKVVMDRCPAIEIPRLRGGTH
jgi:predicted CoA-binding protein